MKQTAVQWYANELNSLNAAYENGKISYVNYHVYKGHLLEQAKEMEKQQIMDAFEQQIIQWVPELLEDGTLKVSNVIKCSKQYYIENYGGEQ